MDTAHSIHNFAIHLGESIVGSHNSLKLRLSSSQIIFRAEVSFSCLFKKLEAAETLNDNALPWLDYI